MTDDPPNPLAKLGEATGLTTLDPTGGLVSAWLAHATTNWSIDSTWRQTNLDLWAEIVTGQQEDREERQQQYQQVQGEFDRHRTILGWLMDDLKRLTGRVEALEAVALGLMSLSERLLRAQPDPEMRPYLVNAFRNTVQNRERFSPTTVQRLIKILAQLGADHIRYLLEYLSGTERANSYGIRSTTAGHFGQMTGSPENQTLHEELQSLSVINMSQGIAHLGVQLADFVTDPDKLK